MGAFRVALQGNLGPRKMAARGAPISVKTKAARIRFIPGPVLTLVAPDRVRCRPELHRAAVARLALDDCRSLARPQVIDRHSSPSPSPHDLCPSGVLPTGEIVITTCAQGSVLSTKISSLCTHGIQKSPSVRISASGRSDPSLSAMVVTDVDKHRLRASVANYELAVS
jgi:hypothetical protein